ncbi:Uncharacterised protein [Anaerobiospirillum thomasii]|uniref:Uncharacterized protein n=1 Tax=Anaerobiospirillum thomasii TaxID=179995 RepID=A0A2X0VP53_9GAMM|nr:Uncharacterised protein [Anaerobiospirillum thomasii]
MISKEKRYFYIILLYTGAFASKIQCRINALDSHLKAQIKSRIYKNAFFKILAVKELGVLLQTLG